MNQVQDDEIDLLEMFQTLWNDKWLISIIVAVAVLLSSGYLLLKDGAYESKLFYTVNTIPPFYEGKKVSNDFKEKFYSPSVFEDWKKSNVNVSLVFEDISDTEVVDGFVLSKGEDKQLATLTFEPKVGPAVIVKSNQLPILNDIFKYATHISRLLSDEYVVRAKDELNIIETRFKDFSTANDAVITQILSIDRYVVSAEQGSSVLAIQRPSMPSKVSPKSFHILILSLILGGTVGAFFVLVRDAIKKRRKQLAKG
jgi:LPS O-antigen subunit length determinant protein (WzzB/FepE family)